uniref:DUF2975 domain-containing protein n=1 Tax=Rhabditophanes sp. KR3021 TaxID=114890 RepID=A0AC35TNG1_9BILA
MQINFDLKQYQELFTKDVICTTIITLCLIAAEIAATFFIQESSFYIMIVYPGFFWQTVVIILIFIVMIYNIYLVSHDLAQRELEWRTQNKIKKLQAHGISVLMIIVAACIETVYTATYSGYYFTYYAFFGRFIVMAVFLWTCFITQIAQIVFMGISFKINVGETVQNESA